MRFVVLRHEERQGVHFDLMIDQGDTLATWRCPVPPETARATGLAIERIGEHRRQYLDYEGPISGDRGNVARHDAGVCIVVSRDHTGWAVRFDGLRLNGEWRIEAPAVCDQGWLLRAVVK